MEIVNRFIERKIPIIPVDPITKAPICGKDWQTKYDTESIKHLFVSENIGMLTGKPSGIIVLDLDATSEEVKKELSEIVKDYPTPIKRFGSKKKLPSMFYSYTNEESKQCKYVTYNKEGKKEPHMVAEILSTGRQCIIPPSKHKEGGEYEWEGNDILDFNLEHLPPFKQEMWERIITVVKNYQSKIDTKKIISEETSNIDKSGRNNKLFEMMSAKIADGVSKEQAVEEIIEYDLSSHVNPWTLDKDEPHKGDKKKAEKYFLNMYDRVLEKEIKNNGTLVDASKVEFNLVEKLPEEKLVKLERKPMPKLRGIGQEMFEYVYNYSFTKRSHFIFPSILSIGSIALGNKIQFRKTLPNIYCLIAGDSTSGKSVAIEFVKELLQKSGKVGELLGEGNPSGDTAIIQNLPNQRVRLDIVDESDNLFATINSTNSYGQKVAYTYAELFTSAGKTFAGKTTSAMKGTKSKESDRGSIGGCYAPYVSLLMGITFEGFKKYVSATTIKQGFLGRFLFFSDNNKKRRKYPTSEQPEMPKNFIDFIKMWRNAKPKKEKEGIDLTQAPALESFHINECLITEEGEIALREAFESIEDIFEKEPGSSDILPIIGRAFEYVKKLAIIDCAFLNPTTTDLKICKTNVDWAYKVVITILENNRSFLPDNINEGLIKEYMRKIEAYLKEKGTVTKKEFTRKFQSKNSKENDVYLKSLEEAGIIEIIKIKDSRQVHIKYL